MPASRAPKTRNPRSNIVKLGSNNEARKDVNPMRKPTVAYPCPFCDKRMYGDEVIDFGPVGELGKRDIKKYHRVCKLAHEANAVKDDE